MEHEHQRKVINDLLSKDKMRFKYYIDYIKKLTDKEIEALFDGQIEVHLDATKADFFKDPPKPYFFKELQQKFQNFNQFLTEWGSKENYEKYKKPLMELWVKFPCIEEIKTMDEAKLENELKYLGIEYDKWDKDVQREFRRLSKETENTELYELKDKIKENIENSSDGVILKGLKELKEKINNGSFLDPNVKKELNENVSERGNSIIAEQCAETYLKEHKNEKLEKALKEKKKGDLSLKGLLGIIKKVFLFF